MALMRSTAFLFMAAAFSSSPAWGGDEPTPIEPEAVSLGRSVDFAADVAPVLEANCVACHNIGIEEGSLSVEDLAGLLEGGDRGPAVVPGKPDESLLLTVAAHRGEPVMPPPDNDVEAKPLSPRELGLIRQWILEGATAGAGTAGPLIAWRPLPASYKAIHGVALSPGARFAAVARGNQLEMFDLVAAERGARLIDPNLASLADERGPLYPNGAAERDSIQAVAFSPDGSLLASGGYRAVKLWRRVGPGAGEVTGMTGVKAFAASPDRSRIAVAAGNEVRLVGAGDGVVASAWPLAAEAAAVTFSSDGQSVAATGVDGSLSTWRVPDGQAGPTRVLPSPATGVAAVGVRIVTAHDDGVLRVWADAEQPERVLSGHGGAVRALAAVPNRPNVFVSGGDDGTVRVWDVTTDAPLHVMQHGSAVTGIAAAPDGGSVVSCGIDGAVRFWKFDDGTKLGEFVGSIPRSREAGEAARRLEWRRQLAAVAETRRKAAEDALNEREEILKKAGEMKVAAERSAAEARKAADEAAAAAKTATEQSAAAPDDAALKSAAEAAGKAAEEAGRKAAAFDEAVVSAARSIGLAEEASASAKARLETRSVEKQGADEAAVAGDAAAQAAKVEAERPVAATDAAFSPDGKRVAVAYAEGFLQTFTATGRPLDAAELLGGPASRVEFVAADEVLATSGDGSVRRVSTVERWEYAGVIGPPQEAPLDVARSAFADRVLALAFSPDGRTLAVGGGEPSRSGELSAWDVETRTQVRTFADAHSDTVQAVAFSADGRVVATGAADKFAKAFDLETGSLIRSFEGHTDHVLGVTLKGDGTEVATAAADTAVKIWDAETGEQRRTVVGHGKQVTAVRYVGLTDQVVTASGDRTVRLYRTADGGHLRSFDGPVDYVHALDASDDGTTVAAGGEEGVLYVWDAATGAVRHRFEAPGASETATAAK